jgi:hypothetical protein
MGPTPLADMLQPHHTHARRDPSRGSFLTGRPKPNLARSAGSRHHPSMPPPPSSTYQRLREYVAKQMRMSPIDQPLML